MGFPSENIRKSFPGKILVGKQPTSLSRWTEQNVLFKVGISQGLVRSQNLMEAMTGTQEKLDSESSDISKGRL